MRGREGTLAEDGGRGGGQEMIKFRNVLMDLRWGDIEESKISQNRAQVTGKMELPSTALGTLCIWGNGRGW